MKYSTYLRAQKIINIEITAFYLWFDKWDCWLCTNFKCLEVTFSLECLSILNAMWMNMNKFMYILYKMINVVYMTLVCFIHIFYADYSVTYFMTWPFSRQSIVSSIVLGKQMYRCVNFRKIELKHNWVCAKYK